jgi:MFS family permease
MGCAYLDCAPKYSSSLNTLGNTMGAVGGIVSPIVVSILVGAFDGSWGWKFTFFLTAVMSGAYP